MEKEDKVVLVSTEEFLIEHRNTFQKQLVDNTLDLQRHLAIQQADPEFQRENPKNGKYVGIAELIENYTNAAKNAYEYLKIINGVLAVKDEEKMVEALVLILNSTTAKVEDAN
jgi:hypothetical protein